MSATPGTGATGGDLGSVAVPALPAANTSPPTAAKPLLLDLPPRTVYRPPIAAPQRSLSEMANDQLRRKPRDAFAEGIEAAGDVDCLKGSPDSIAQGLLAIGPLLKRALEDKCKR